MEKKFINPAEIHKPTGYTHAVAVDGGRTIFIAGQVGVDQAGQLAGNDLRSQAQKAAENLIAALKAAGAAPSDIVKLNTYVVNYSRDDYKVIREVRSAIFPAANPPASTLIGVQALAFEGLLIEMEAIAVVS
ncbi:MAG: RidA family protein [Candidatus Binataceae bacterium]